MIDLYVRYSLASLSIAMALSRGKNIADLLLLNYDAHKLDDVRIGTITISRHARNFAGNHILYQQTLTSLALS